MRSGFANAFIYACYACLGLRVSCHPTQLDTLCCGYIVLRIHQQLHFKCTSSRSTDKCNQPIELPRLWGSNQSKCSFLLVISNVCTWILKYVNGQSAVVSVSNEMLEIQPSCSSHHVECTKTWMRDLSPVCGSLNYSQPNHTHLTTIRNEMQGSGNWW